MKRIHLLCAVLALSLSACISSSFGTRDVSAAGETSSESSVGLSRSESSSSLSRKSVYQVCMDEHRGYNEALSKAHCEDVVQALHEAKMNPCKPFGYGYGYFYPWSYAYPQPASPCVQAKPKP